MRWKWRWDERYLTRTRRGERKRRGKEQTHTNTPSPERANPEKAREKKKAEGRRTRNKTRGGGEGRKRLNQPDTARTYTHLGTRRSQPTWGGKNAWDRGPMGISWWKHKNETKTQFLNLKVVRLCHSRPVVNSCPNRHITASKFQRIRCTICLTSPENHQKKEDHTWKSCACLVPSACCNVTVMTNAA